MKLVNCTSTSGKGKTGYNLSVLMINQPPVRLLIYFGSGRKKAGNNDAFEPKGDAKHLLRPANAYYNHRPGKRSVTGHNPAIMRRTGRAESSSQYDRGR
ncbi:hypothetical protein AHX05_06890 [Salmonella enterica subsp. indica]|uniref:Uncharacterized protein n=1 Tax=Salmonella enterica TaxID=28901 RepID=A0A701ZFC1_SALER|nr:hypothetical protein [Salmonella enterica subsp. indica]EBH9038083.1 hypothetical protein [Salmonella enterica subsp. indica serovar 11:b:e,n,x]ECI8270951.1 hypothetical protein [Salmonella enterica subsp. enterica]ECC3876509.1 hypothetical protein [Salmonella enterica subsp. indica]ECG1333939.1 hypothetical protein [Salmonella enterica subsp. indica]